MVPTVTVFTRASCHLCDEALAIVDAVRATSEFTLTVVDVDSDAALVAQMGDLVPVVEVDGERVGFWRIREQALRAAIDKAARQ